MTKLNLILGLFTCFILFSCDSNNEPTLTPLYEEDTVFILEFDETSNCSCEEGPEISFTQIVDESRCPTSVICVWEGQVVVNLNISNEDIELGISPSQNIQSIDTIGNWSVELLEVRPYPESPDETISQED